MKNRYTEMRQRQQEEFNALPLGFAFSDAQFNEMMRGWGLDPEKDLGKIYKLPGGGFIQKKHQKLLHDTLDKHEAELQAAIDEDKTGEGFIYEMFLAELENHEYSYTGDTTEALMTLGYTAEEVVADERLNRGITMAHNAIMGGDSK